MKKANTLKNKFKTRFALFGNQNNSNNNNNDNNNINDNNDNIDNNNNASGQQSQSYSSSQNSQSSITSLAREKAEMTKGRFYFNEGHRTYSCIHCRAQLASHDELVSKLFQGNQGRAYLFNKVVNVLCRQPVRRQLLTGPHDVADIYCGNCETTLGWKYEFAYLASQKYKEGKYIIELIHMYKGNQWDITSYNSQSIIRDMDLACGRVFDVDDFTIGKNYFGSLDMLERHQRKIFDDPEKNRGVSLEKSTSIDDESNQKILETIDGREKILNSSKTTRKSNINGNPINDSTKTNTSLTSTNITNPVDRHSTLESNISNDNNPQISENNANDNNNCNNNPIADAIINDDRGINVENNAHLAFFNTNRSSQNLQALRHDAPIDAHHQHHTQPIPLERYRKPEESIDMSKLFIDLSINLNNSCKLDGAITTEKNNNDHQ